MRISDWSSDVGSSDLPAEPARAAGLYREAAGLGVSEAFLNLGNLYASGEGVDADPVQALAWLTLAAEAGVEGADGLCPSVEAVLSAEERARAAPEAKPWKAEQHGRATCGEGVRQYG